MRLVILALYRCTQARHERDRELERELEKMLSEKGTKSSKSKSMIEEVLKLLEFSSETILENPMATIWRVEDGEGGIVLVILEQNHLLKFQAFFNGPSGFETARSMIFANEWNKEKRFTKLIVDRKENHFQLEMDLNLESCERSSAVSDAIRFFRMSMVGLQVELEQCT